MKRPYRFVSDGWIWTWDGSANLPVRSEPAPSPDAPIGARWCTLPDAARMVGLRPIQVHRAVVRGFVRSARLSIAPKSPPWAVVFDDVLAWVKTTRLEVSVPVEPEMGLHPTFDDLVAHLRKVRKQRVAETKKHQRDRRAGKRP